MALRVAPNQRLDIALAASRLDLDAWLPVLLRAGNTIAGIDVPIGIDVSAEAAPLAGGTLEHVRAAFDVIDKDLVVREASALLPGNGTLQLRGRIARDDPAPPRFDGDARLDAPLLRTTLRWLEGALPGSLPPHLLADLPDSVAQRGELSAHVVVGGGEVALRQIVGMLDDVPVAGNLGFKRGEPPALTADLSLDRLALDQWLPPRMPDLADLSGPVSGLDAELRLTIRQATLAGTTIDGLAIDAAIEAGAVLLRRIEGTARERACNGLRDAGRRQAERWQAQYRNQGRDQAGRAVARNLVGDAGIVAWAREIGCADRGTAGGAGRRCGTGIGRCSFGGESDSRPAIGRVEHDADLAPSRCAPTDRSAGLVGT